MSGQLKLSKVFFVNPTLLPPPQFDQAPADDELEKDIFTNGFDSKHPIIVQVPKDKFGGPVRWKQEMLNEFPRFPSDISIKELLYTPPSVVLTQHFKILDGNHRLAIALELNLDRVPVRFQYMICN